MANVGIAASGDTPDGNVQSYSNNRPARSQLSRARAREKEKGPRAIRGIREAKDMDTGTQKVEREKVDIVERE